MESKSSVNLTANQQKIIDFQFSGKGSEFFRIWIVNLALSIVTLGIYSAWAKVRTQRYFYSHTSLDGSSFQYLANPVTILKGRLIAVGVIVLVSLVNQIWPLTAPLAALAFFLLTPFLIVSSLRFRATNSAIRGVRFGFDGSYGQAVGPFLGWPLLGILSFGLLYPIAVFKQSAFVATRHRFGKTFGDFNASTGDYYKVFLMILGLSIVLGIVMSFIMGFAAVLLPETAMAFLPILMLPIYFVVFDAMNKAWIINLFINSLSLGGIRMNSNLKLFPVMGVLATNTLIIIFTLGLGYPLAKVRWAQYRASQSSIEVSEQDWARIEADNAEQQKALGDEMSDMLDLDFSL